MIQIEPNELDQTKILYLNIIIISRIFVDFPFSAGRLTHINALNKLLPYLNKKKPKKKLVTLAHIYVKV